MGAGHGRASEDRGQLDLDVRRPLSKRGTLEATARQQSASGRSPVPTLMQLPEGQEGPHTLPCPCPRAPCSALRLGRGMLPALDHLLVRLLINQPWTGTQAPGLGLFGHPPLRCTRPPAAHQGSLPTRGPVESSRFAIVLTLLAIYGITGRRRGSGRRRGGP